MEDIDKSDLEELKHRVKDKLAQTELYSYKGTVSKLLGLTVEVKLPGLKIGENLNPQKFKLLRAKLLNYHFCLMVAELVREV